MKVEKKHLFDNPKNIKRLLQIFYVCCALLVVLDFVIHRHTIHHWEQLWAFYPIYGFIGCVVLVLVATWMRTFLMRPEDYYDKPTSEKPTYEKPIVTESPNDALQDKAGNKKGEHHVDD